MMTKYDGRVQDSTEAADRARGNRYRSVSLGDEKNSLHIYVHTNPASVAVMPSKDSKFLGGHSSVLIAEKDGALRVFASGMEVPTTEFLKNPDTVRYLFDAGNEAVERGLTATSAGRIISLANQVAEQAPSVAESGQRMNLSPAPRGNLVPEQQRNR